MRPRALVPALALAAAGALGLAQAETGVIAWIDVDKTHDGAAEFRAMAAGPSGTDARYEFTLESSGRSGRSTTRQAGQFDFSDSAPRLLSTVRLSTDPAGEWRADLRVVGPAGEERARAMLSSGPEESER